MTLVFLADMQVWKHRNTGLVCVVGFLVWLLFLSQVSFAVSGASSGASSAQHAELSLAESRTKYKQAKKHLKTNRISAFKKAKAALSDYPLLPYLEYEYYRTRMHQVSETEALTFIDTYADSPISYRFKKNWLKHLFESKEYGLFLTHYLPKVENISNQFQCFNAVAYLELGDDYEAFQLADNLWMTGKSQSAACDPLFGAWESAGYLTEKKRWKRIQLAMRAGNHSLAKFLAKELKSPEKKQKFDIWSGIYTNPAKLKSPKMHLVDTPEYREIILHGFKRWVRKDKAATLKYLPKYLSQYNFTPTELDEYVGYVARFISFSYHPEAYYWLVHSDLDSNDKKVLQRRRMVAIHYQNWPGVLTWTQQSSTKEDERLMNQYLYARALEQLSQDWSRQLLQHQPISNQLIKNHLIKNQPGYFDQASKQSLEDGILSIHRQWISHLTEPMGIVKILGLGKSPQDLNRLAKSKYRQIYAYRRYYGFLASERLNKPLSMHANIQRYPAHEVERVKNMMGIKRAYEFYMLEDLPNASREWHKVIKRLNARDSAIAARVADNWSWHFQAIMTATRSSQRDNLDLRFPRAHQDIVSHNANRVGISMDWVFSVIRQESAFKKQARSSVGALGMMQIMPGTAKYISRRIGETYRNKRSLLDPSKNIRLGTAYLKELYDRFDKNILMATAAYNAGPHRVKKWRPKHTRMDGDLWVETIPFEETQHYVKNIVTYQAIYRYQMGQEPKLTLDLKSVNPKLNSKKPGMLKSKSQLASK